MENEINALMARCEAARRRSTATDDFKILYFGACDQKDQSKLWYVGTYTNEGGNYTAEGPTLESALVGWLADWEHRWD